MSEIRLLINDQPYTTGITKPYEGSHVQECSICLSNDEFTYKSWVELKCGHCFHRHCIDLWLENHRTCPICIQEVGKRLRVSVLSETRMKSQCPLLAACITIAGALIVIIVVYFK